MNYYHAFEMLKDLSLGIIRKNMLNLFFKERFVRSSNRTNIRFELNSLDYQTARFIDGIYDYEWKEGISGERKMIDRPYAMEKVQRNQDIAKKRNHKSPLIPMRLYARPSHDKSDLLFFIAGKIPRRGFSYQTILKRFDMLKEGLDDD